MYEIKYQQKCIISLADNSEVIQLVDVANEIELMIENDVLIKFENVSVMQNLAFDGILGIPFIQKFSEKLNFSKLPVRQAGLSFS